MTVEVACALPDAQALVSLQVPRGTTAQAAVDRAGLLARFPVFAEQPLCLGIYGRRVPAEQVLEAGDRVELYRPLAVDPKQARRRRVTDKR